jgi:hypothetical protein
LGLVDCNRARVRIEKPFQIGSEHGKIGWTFQIEVGPFRKGMACKSALATLAWPHKEDSGKRSEEGLKTIGTQSIDISHNLQLSIKSSNLQGILSMTASREEGFFFHETPGCGRSEGRS